MSLAKLLAIHVFCNDFHSGQRSRGYKMLCVSGQRLKKHYFIFEGIDFFNNNPRNINVMKAKDIYDRLVAKHCNNI